MQIAKGLIIADPWIGYILDGSKTWEMRSSETSVRGPLALIRKGTGAIWGIATLVDVGRTLTPAEMVASIDKHCIPADMIRSGEVAKWNVPWILSDIRRLATPVAYEHPNGAVTWVNLAEHVSQGIAAQLRDAPDAPSSTPEPTPLALKAQRNGEREAVTTTSSKGTGRLIVQTQLTEGNIKHSHFYLRGYLHRFPSDLVGGSNKQAKAPKDAVIDWGGASPVITDIDGEKEFFRARGWIKQFFEATGACRGDWVLVEEAASYRYKVRLEKA